MMDLQKNIKSFKRKFFKNDGEKICKSNFEKMASSGKNSQNKENSPTLPIAFEATEDIYYYIIFGILINSLREKHNVLAYRLVTHYFSPGESNNIIIFFIKNIITRLGNLKWNSLYSVFSTSLTQTSNAMNLRKNLNAVKQSYLIWNKLKDKDTLLNLTYENIWIGDLVIDTFLRFKPAPNVNLRDLFLLVVLWRSIKEVHRSKAFIETVKPSIYLTPYTTYVQHGIPTRVAIKCGVKVFAFGNYQEFMKLITSSDLVHTKNCDFYAVKFNSFIDVEFKRNQAEVILKKRFSGVIDPSLSYMRKSAYSYQETASSEVKNAFVIFLHDFYDSPHVYKDMVFNDFWDWICYTIEELESLNAKYVIKPHPNQIDLSNEVLIRLKSCYPKAFFLSEHVNNVELVKGGIKCAITVYGTVAHEMAYLGIPTISCARHPHSSFDFVLNANTLEHYSSLLAQVNSREGSLSWNASEMRSQSLAFVFMHYLNQDNDENELLDNLALLRKEININEVDQLALTSLIDKIMQSAGVKDFVNNFPHCGYN